MSSHSKQRERKDRSLEIFRSLFLAKDLTEETKTDGNPQADNLCKNRPKYAEGQDDCSAGLKLID